MRTRAHALRAAAVLVIGVVVALLASTCRFSLTAPESGDASAPVTNGPQAPAGAPTVQAWLESAAGFDAGVRVQRMARGGGPTTTTPSASGAASSAPAPAAGTPATTNAPSTAPPTPASSAAPTSTTTAQPQSGNPTGYRLPAPPTFGPATASNGDAGAASDAGAGPAAANPQPDDTGAATAARPRVPTVPRFMLERSDGVAVVVPPTHPGPQPVIVVVEPDRCAPVVRACETAERVAPPYGWMVCLRPAVTDPTTCSPATRIDASALLAAALDAIDTRAPGSTLAQSGVLVAPRPVVAGVTSLHAAAPARWTYALVIDPDPRPRAWTDAEAAALRGIARVALVRSRGVVAASSPSNGARITSFAPARNEVGYDTALRFGLTWTFAGADSALCAPGASPPRGAVGRHLCESAPDAGVPPGRR